MPNKARSRAWRMPKGKEGMVVMRWLVWVLHALAAEVGTAAQASADGGCNASEAHNGNGNAVVPEAGQWRRLREGASAEMAARRTRKWR